jgi:anti-sigma factor RsiW
MSMAGWAVDRRREVEQFLATHPEDMERARAYQEQNQAFARVIRRRLIRTASDAMANSKTWMEIFG